MTDVWKPLETALQGEPANVVAHTDEKVSRKIRLSDLPPLVREVCEAAIADALTRGDEFDVARMEEFCTDHGHYEWNRLRVGEFRLWIAARRLAAAVEEDR